MLNIFTDKEATLKFGLNVEGNKSQPTARLVLLLESGLNFFVKAKIEEGIAYVNVPPLKTILKNSPSNTAKTFLEVIVDDSYYVPWKDTCELKESVSIKVNENVEVTQQTETIKIHVQSAPIEEEAPILFKDSELKKEMSLLWKKYKTLKEKENYSVYDRGAFEGLDSLVSQLKNKANITLSDSIQVINKFLNSKKQLTEEVSSAFDKELLKGTIETIQTLIK